MKNHIPIIIILAIVNYSCTQFSEKGQATDFAVEILDDEALKIIASDADIRALAGGFSWTEGPLWIEAGQYLLFSDIPGNKVYKLDANRDTSVYLHPAGYTEDIPRGGELGSNGLILNQQGELVLLQHGDRRVARMNASLDSPRANFVTLVAEYDDKRFNSPNDGTFDSKGNLYFTDPPYGLPEGVNDPSKELSFQGVYCLKTSGELLLLDSLTRPNGIALSPDESKLYVAVSDSKHAVWYVYDVKNPGEVDNKQLFYDVTELIGTPGNQGLPDGMKVSHDGYLFATGPGGVWIFNPQGKAIARIFTGLATSNCAFSTDEKRLFLTADDYVLSVELL